MISADAVVTFERPDGFSIVRSCGLVRARVIVPRSVVRSAVRSLGSFLGMPFSDYPSEAERVRARVLERLRERAGDLGANGIVGLTFDAHQNRNGATSVTAYGEAVVLRAVRA